MFSLRILATLRNKRKLAAVSRETPEKTRNRQSKNTLDPRIAQEYISQVSEEIERRVIWKLSREFRRTESRILGALSKLDEFLLYPQVRTCSIAVPRASRNNDLENREPTGDRSPGDPCPEAVFSTYHSSNLNDSEQEETNHRNNWKINNNLLKPQLEFAVQNDFKKSCTGWISVWTRNSSIIANRRRLSPYSCQFLIN